MKKLFAIGLALVAGITAHMKASLQDEQQPPQTIAVYESYLRTNHKRLHTLPGSRQATATRNFLAAEQRTDQDELEEMKLTIEVEVREERESFAKTTETTLTAVFEEKQRTRIAQKEKLFHQRAELRNTVFEN